MRQRGEEAVGRADPPGPLLIGVVHLAPLPGSPRAVPMTEVLQRAARDLDAWLEGGADAVLVENFGDRPFHGRRVPAVTVAALSAVLAELRRQAPSARLGVNVLRNDGHAALSLAAVHDLEMVRVNVLCGAAVTDQGLIEGEAADLLRLRAGLGARAKIWADARVKHARPLAERPLREEVSDLVQRGLADAVLLTGPATGAPVVDADLDAVLDAAPGVPVLLASGVDPGRVAATRQRVGGYVVGTFAKESGQIDRPVDPARVRALHQARI